MILFVLPTCHSRPLNRVPAAPPPRRKSRRPPRWRRRRRMRLGDVGGGDFLRETFQYLPTYMFVCVKIYIYIYICLVLYVIYVYSRWLNSIYLHIHIIFEDGTYILYSMWLYIHSRFNFARWGNHLWGGCAKKHRPLKGAWKNDGFIVSSTYFFVLFFLYRGDMHRKPCSFLALKFDESMTWMCWLVFFFYQW